MDWDRFNKVMVGSCGSLDLFNHSIQSYLKYNGPFCELMTLLRCPAVVMGLAWTGNLLVLAQYLITSLPITLLIKGHADCRASHSCWKQTRPSTYTQRLSVGFNCSELDSQGSIWKSWANSSYRPGHIVLWSSVIIMTIVLKLFSTDKWKVMSLVN